MGIDAMDAATAGQVLGYIGMAAAGAWAVWERWSKTKASNDASIADSRAEKAVADSQATVYTLMSQRLTSLENDVNNLRNELAEERKHSRKLELHIWKLEGIMRDANMTPPTFDTAVP